MENASKALLIAGAILLAILIIAIGMFIYNSSQSTITNSMNSLSTQEVDAFNNQFVVYEGAQTGSKLKALVGVLISNSNTYSDEVEKIPSVSVKDKLKASGNGTYGANKPANAGSTNEYVTALGKVRNAIETKHTYWVEMVYGVNGLVNEIVIYYDQSNVE